MVYKVEIILPNGSSVIVYEGSDKKSADDAWLVTQGCGYTREYYEGIVTWQRTKSLLS